MDPAKILMDLDRCQHGRHAADRCLECPDGQSTGNLYLPPGTRIGTSVHGQAIVVPRSDRRRFFDEWYQGAE